MAKPDINEIDKGLVAEVEANKSKVPDAVQHVLVQCQSALYWGGNWSLLANNDADFETIKAILPDLKPYSQHLKFSKARGGLVLEADPKWLLSIMNTLAPTYSAKQAPVFMQRVKETAAEEVPKFQKYWKRVQEGKTDFFNEKDKNGNKRLVGTIGVYCTNVNNSFTVNGIDYPAFKLPPVTVCNVLSQAPGADRIVVAVHNDGQSQWVPLHVLMQTKNFGSALSFPVDEKGNVISRPNAMIMRIAVK